MDAARLRDAFNTGCGAVFEQADRPLRQVTGQSWMDECRHLRADLGNWLYFKVETNRFSAPAHGVKLVTLTGQAGFTRDRYFMQLVWQFETGTPKLSSWELADGLRVIRSFPPLTP